jgi:DNA-binding response OmpR family regulator
MQRGRGRAREAVCAGALQRLERELPADALSLSVVRDFNRDLGHVRLIRHLHTREELLREVWGHEWTGAGSNVVEAVVSGLRKKMGDRAGALETVRGVGYRLGPLD